jgi:hypothetical protein
MLTENTRRSDRIRLALPIEVSGSDINSQSFTEETQTVVITRDGAAIVLSRQLAPGGEVTIRRIDAGKQAAFRVVGQMGRQEDSNVYGVVARDDSLNLWDIEFPPLAESEEALGRVLLQCGSCQTREIAHLDEFEMEVFKTSGSVWRTCKRCGDSTEWQLVPHETPAQIPSEGVEPGAVPEAAPSLVAQDRRKEPRAAKLQLTACIRQDGTEDDVVVTENISRTGLCFRSKKQYPEGTSIEVAVPYTRESANIFVPARIVYSKELKPAGVFRHGVEYLKRQKGQQPVSSTTDGQSEALK